jgi:hypothetical protein
MPISPTISTDAPSLGRRLRRALGVDEPAFLAGNADQDTQFATGVVDVSASRGVLDVVQGRSGTGLCQWIRGNRVMACQHHGDRSSPSPRWEEATVSRFFVACRQPAQWWFRVPGLIVAVPSAFDEARGLLDARPNCRNDDDLLGSRAHRPENVDKARQSLVRYRVR